MTKEKTVKKRKPVIACTPELFREVCAELIGSSDSIGTICERNPSKYPTERSIWNWIKNNEGAEAIFLDYKKVQAHYIAEEIINIADCIKRKKDYYDKYAVNRDRLRIEARDKIMKNLNPKVYGTDAEKKLIERLDRTEALLKEIKERESSSDA